MKTKYMPAIAAKAGPLLLLAAVAATAQAGAIFNFDADAPGTAT